MNHLWYSINTYRRAQHETPEACAARLAQMVESFGEIHGNLAKWFAGAEKRGSGSIPTEPLLPVHEALARLFSVGRIDRIAAHVPMPELGYQINASNGRDDDRRAILEIIAGSYTNSRPFPNMVSFELRKPTAKNGDLVTPDVLRSSLLGIISAWQPDYAVLEDRDYWAHLQPDDTAHLPKVRSGWITYLSAPYARRIVPPSEVKRELVKGGGLLMTATEELFSADNPAHIAAADAVQAALRPLQ